MECRLLVSVVCEKCYPRGANITRTQNDGMA